MCPLALTAAERSVSDELSRVFGSRLRSASVVRSGLGRPHDWVDARVAYALLPTPHGRVPNPLAPDNARHSLHRSTFQWHKLRWAWRAMEEAEHASGERYATVLRLRFDVVLLGQPAWQLCAAADWLRPSDPPAVHAMSDLVFWGRRDAMAVLATLWDHIAYFERSRYNVPDWRPHGLPSLEAPPDGIGRPRLFDRPVPVRALLTSVLSLPKQAWADWTLYQKLGHIGMPDFGLEPKLHVRYKPGTAPKRLTGARIAMLSNLREASRRGLAWVDPLAIMADDAPYNFTGMVTCGAPAGKCAGGLHGVFNTERDMLQWLLLHNVTICDVGAGTTAVLHKDGRTYPRVAYDGCADHDAPMRW
jgi:hypothetical protein